MILNRLNSLSAQKKALVALAVLIDGREANAYLKSDSILGDVLSKAAAELSELEPELRMPLAGSILREAIQEIGRQKVENLL